MKALTDPPDSGPRGTSGSRSAKGSTVPNAGENQEFEPAGRVVTGRFPASRPVAASPNPVRRAAPTLRPPLWDEVTDLVCLYAQKRRGAVVRHDPPMDARGLPVLLVGGFTSIERTLSPLREWLDRLNCRCLVAPIRYGVSCGAQGARYVEQALERLTDATGQPALVIAHSRGGQFARATAVRRPELHRGLITLGSPLRRLLAVHPLLLAQVAAVGLAGSLGVPGLMRLACLWGKCCAGFRMDLQRPFPPEVPFLSVYSPYDQVVDWRSTLDPAARHRSISATHAGLLWSPESLSVVAEEIRALLHGETTAGRTSWAA
jgi:pimeloyl-ACP methyl ester carboxylesterase